MGFSLWLFGIFESVGAWAYSTKLLKIDKEKWIADYTKANYTTELSNKIWNSLQDWQKKELAIDAYNTQLREMGLILILLVVLSAIALLKMIF